MKLDSSILYSIETHFFELKLDIVKTKSLFSNKHEYMNFSLQMFIFIVLMRVCVIKNICLFLNFEMLVFLT